MSNEKVSISELANKPEFQKFIRKYEIIGFGVFTIAWFIIYFGIKGQLINSAFALGMVLSGISFFFLGFAGLQSGKTSIINKILHWGNTLAVIIVGYFVMRWPMPEYLLLLPMITVVVSFILGFRKHLNENMFVKLLFFAKLGILFIMLLDSLLTSGLIA